MRASPTFLCWLRRHRFLLLLSLTYAYFFQGGDPNQAGRLYLTSAIVDRHVLDITPDHARTIDKAEFNGKFYADKAPGISLLAIVPYAAVRLAERLGRIEPERPATQRTRLHAVVIVVVGLSGLVASAMVRRSLVLLGVSGRAASLVTFGYALGTLAFPFSTVLFSHQTAAAILATAFAMSLRDREHPTSSVTRRLALGALYASALVTEYPTALIVGVLGVHRLSVAGSLRGALEDAAVIALGAIPILLLHSAMLWAQFGSPFSLAYTHEVDPIFRAHMSAGFMGIGEPRGSVATAALFGPYRGLFFYSPFLALTVAGFAAWIARGERLIDAGACAAICGLSILLTSSYYAWDGGFSIGPRHMVPALPFLVVPIGWWTGRSRWAERLTVAVIVPSVIIMVACTAVLVQTPEADPSRGDPLYAIVIPALFRHQVALNPLDVFHSTWHHDASYNLGTLMGLGAWSSILSLALVWVVSYSPELLARRA